MTLTFFFSDVEDSSGLAARLGESYPGVLAEARELQRDAIARAGGREIDCRGDEFFAVFDQPAAAAAAAIEIQQAFAIGAWPPGEHVRARIGLHSGEAESAGDGYVGIEVHRASRICQAGHGGQVL
ncbi:MAG TPA: adenylate/guanylate cyclase domain-containing protein, partial [Gaiellaceae bacterium]|nr:adenylate/guanylate cyclase domain-containing protein [Gaiellaceae bacterium]